MCGDALVGLVIRVVYRGNAYRRNPEFVGQGGSRPPRPAASRQDPQERPIRGFSEHPSWRRATSVQGGELERVIDSKAPLTSASAPRMESVRNLRAGLWLDLQTD